MKTYKFRLYPNKTQSKQLEFTLNHCRVIYNLLLSVFSDKPEGYTESELKNYLLDLKSYMPQLKNIHSKVLQTTAERIFRSLKSLAALKKNGHKVGRLRFKGKNWFKTFTYNQSGFKITDDKKLYLSKIGNVSIKLHREPKGNIKQIQIKKEIDKWYAFVVTDYKSTDYKSSNNEVGFDLGIMKFITDHNNDVIKNPYNVLRYMERLKYAHRQVSKCKKGSNNRYKRRIILQRYYSKLRNSRTDFLHKTSTTLIKQNHIIYMENLNIKNMMMQKNHNAKNIADVSWYRFEQFLTYKAESAGCKIVKVNPKNTSKTCSACGNIKQDLKLFDRTYICSNCGLEIDRDHNAAINIFNKGKELAFVESSIHTDSLNQQIVTMKHEAPCESGE